MDMMSTLTQLLPRCLMWMVLTLPSLAVVELIKLSLLCPSCIILRLEPSSRRRIVTSSPGETFTSGAHLVNALAQALSVKTLTSGPSDLDALILHLKQHYSACPLLLLLDNFETPWEIASAQEDVGHVLQCLCHIRQVTIVVTSDATSYNLSQLKLELSWAPIQAEPWLAEPILSASTST